MNRILLILLIAAGAASCGLAQQPAPVRVKHGLVKGTVEDGVTVYRGIPFAAPPVGDLRWRAPQLAARWDGVKQTTNFAPGPIQGGTKRRTSSGPDEDKPTPHQL